MKCPQCSSDLNLKDLVALPRPGRVEVTLCAFCGCFVHPDAEGVLRILRACGGCGAPVDESSNGGSSDCVTCVAEYVTAGALPTPQEFAATGSRILREALRVFPPHPGEESIAYFDQVLRSLSASVAGDWAPYRLRVTSELGFRTLSIPGGTILAGSELIAGIEDEAMFAFVLAREIAHQDSGRVLRRSRSRRDSWARLGTLEWGLGVLTRGALTTGRGDAAILREVARLGYGPEHEQHADAEALKTISTVGYDLTGAVRYLTLLEKRHLAARGVFAAFLDSHPARSRRRCLAETLVAIGGERQKAPKVNRDAYRRAASRFAADRDEPVGAGRGPQATPVSRD